MSRLLLMLFLLAQTVSHAQFGGRKFVIDPGHGGTDPGAVGIDGGATPNEEDFVLDVALRLRTRLQAAGATVILTRTTDTNVSLTARRDLANAEDPDAFLSIHCNSFSDPAANGTETFWHNSVGNAADQSLAAKMQNRMLAAFGLRNRGVKTANFTVLTAAPPAALAEMMFISNADEFALMNTPSVRQDAAEAFYHAMGDFLGIDTSAPVINTQPGLQTVNPGGTATFTVAATGTNLTYRWRKDGVNLSNGGGISGATSPTLTITNTQLARAGFYSVAVTSGSSTTLSNEAQLVVTAAPSAPGSGTGLRGTYYDDIGFTALRRARVDSTVNFNWGTGSPSSTMQADTFSVRWTGQVQPRYSQTYTFYFRSDDGARLWVNNVLLIDQFDLQGATEWEGTIALAAGQKYELRIDYFENGGTALAELRWSSPSQVKQIIPAAQLYRPPPVLASIPPATILQGQPLSLAVVATAFDPVLSSSPWADFEGSADGATDQVVFRKPHHSSSTSAFLDAGKARETTVRASFPAGNSSTRALHARWSWATANTGWLRLTTAGTATLPNPVIDFRRTLRFDVWSANPLKVGLGLRETNSAGAIGSDGGITGPIEFVGANSVASNIPSPARTIPAGAWTTVDFNLPAEPVRAFTGNGVLESTTGLGVLEHLCIAPGSAALDQNLYLDNFVVVEKNRLTYSLLTAPAGATIDPQTGAIGWTPTAAQAGLSHPFTVQVSDAGSPPATAVVTFDVAAAPFPEIVATTRAGSNFTFAWKAAPGAKYDIESAPHPGGPWTVLTEVTAGTAVASHTGPIGTSQRYFRARLK